jgi:hypothetical protein
MTEIQTTPHPRGVEIAKTIKSQIGLDSWLAVSAREPRWWTSPTGDVVVAFRFGSAYGLAKWCEITYSVASDDYDVLAYKIHRNGMKRTLSAPDTFAENGIEVCAWDGVYFDALPRLVRRANLIGELS